MHPAMDRAMEDRLRFVAAVAAIALLLGALFWGLIAFVAAATDYQDWCEDAGICFEAKPVPATVQSVAAFAGIAAVIWIAARFIRYARSGRRPTGLIRAAAVIAISFPVWYSVASDAFGWEFLWR